MKKNLILTVICAICALAIAFVACKKEEEGTAKTKPNKAMTNLADLGIYNDFELGLYSLNENKVKSENTVIQRTEFENGEVWVGGKADIYHISIGKDGKEYSSFCGAYISNSFGVSPDYQSAALNPVKKAQIISALNYVFDTYGSVNGWVECSEPKGDITPANATYVVSQCVIWMILDYIGADGNLVQPQNGIKTVYPEYANPGKEYRWYSKFGAHIVDKGDGNVWVSDVDYGFEDAIDAAYAAATTGFVGTGTVKDIAYLAGPNYPNDIASWQPQIIPLGGVEPVCVEFTKKAWLPASKLRGIAAERLATQGEFSFQLSIKEGTTYTPIATPVATALDGKISFCGLLDGDYKVQEVAKGNWTVQTFTFSIVNGAVVNGPANGTIVNKPKEGPSVGTVTAIATSDYTTWFNLPANQKNDNKNNPININRIVTGANHFTCIATTTANLAAGFEIKFVVGNKVDVVGTGWIQKVGNDIVLTIDDYSKGDFGLVAFTNWAGIPKNGNIHSINKEADMKTLGAAVGVKSFDHDKKLVVPCPVTPNATGAIYVYFHAGAMNFYLPV
jgi:hypothetical protein